MSLLDWIIATLPLLLVLALGIYSNQYVRGVADFMSAGRCAGRYLLAIANGELGAGAVVFVASFEMISKAGFTLAWWNWCTVPFWIFVTISGFVIYRYRETRAMTLGQFFEIRYNKSFRLFTGLLGFLAGILNFGIIPAVGARCMVYFLGLPEKVAPFSFAIPTYIPLMTLFMCITLFVALSGGIITVLVANCLEGIMTQVFYLVIIAALLTLFSWSQISFVLGHRPPGESLLNPFDSGGIRDFNFWYVVMNLGVALYIVQAWQNASAYKSAGFSAHESVMGAVLARLREISRSAVVTLLGVCAITFLHHPDFAAQAARVQVLVHHISDPQAREQMEAPIAIATLLPIGVKGVFCAVLLMGIFGGDSTHLHSWGSIFVQDFLVPLRRKPFGPRQHIWILRCAIVGVAIFALVFGATFSQTQYISMWFGITQSVFTGGAGAAIIGGLYWKKGNAAGAWAAMVTGAVLSFGGIVLQTIYGAAFPLNGVQISFFVPLIVITIYVAVSLLTHREDFNLDRMLHRGEFAAADETAAVPVEEKSWWQRLAGFDENFTPADKWIAGFVLGWAILWFAVFIIGTTWNFIAPWSLATWSLFWEIVGIGIPIFLAVVVGIWFTWGGIPRPARSLPPPPSGARQSPRRRHSGRSPQSHLTSSMKTTSRKSATRRVHYILSTHWDREWYQTFQDYRRRLVQLLDRTLDAIAAGELKGPFTLDGQAILIEDYLEIRPERRAQLERAIQAGQIKVGPWYILPDEWLVSGESLIRNLELGRKIARQWGVQPSNAGFVCDLFGHISQLPQILVGFGITGGFIWRGLEPRVSAHVIWHGADGTELPCYRFGPGGYCDYAFDVRHSHLPNHAFDPITAATDLKTFLTNEAARTSLPPVLLFDGGDHLEFDADHYRVLLQQATGADFPYEIVHSTLDDYLEEMLQHRASIKHKVAGELREAGRLPREQDQQWLIPGVLSSRVWIKQANVECQTLLCQWAEPFASLATLGLGAEYPQAYLDVAWRWLLQNHPHDSICGCSIDQVHEDMKYRFAQCRQIATAQVDESLNLLAAAVEGEVGEKQMRVLVANPLAREIDEPVDLVLHIPATWGTFSEFFGFEPKPGFRIEGADGREIPYQMLALSMNRTTRRLLPLKFPEAYKTHAVTVALRLKIPALGYTTLLVREGERSGRNAPIPEGMLPTRHPQTPGLATSECSMENETLAVRIEMNGSLTVTDKRSGEVYHRLLTFENRADIGDGWFHGPAVNDQVFASTAARCEIALISDGRELCRFRIRTTLLVPAEFDFESSTRSSSLAPLIVESEITLRAGCDRIEVTTTVVNTIKDHRLRVLFPSAVRTDTYFADSAFDVVERPIGLPADNHTGRELAVETTPQQTWTGVARGKRGLAIVSTALMESTVRDLPERPIALTLFRSTRRTVMTDGEPGGQLLEEMKFRYWIVPVAKGLDRRQLGDAGLQLAAGIRSAQMDAAAVAHLRGSKRIAKQGSLLSLKGGAVLSSVRHVGDSLQVRVYNPEDAKKSVSLQLGDWSKKKALRATPVDFEGHPSGKVLRVDSAATLPLSAKQIVTLKVSSSRP